MPLTKLHVLSSINRYYLGITSLCVDFQEYLPRQLVDRLKNGFGLPLDNWLRGSLKEWAEDLINEATLCQDSSLGPVPILRKWKEHTYGQL